MKLKDIKNEVERIYKKEVEVEINKNYEFFDKETYKLVAVYNIKQGTLKFL